MEPKGPVAQIPAHTFSYLDTTLRIIHLNIREREGDESLVDYRNLVEKDLSYHRQLKSYLIRNFINKQKETHPEIRFLLLHETHHYWQTLFYPCLYFLSYLEFKSICGAMNNIRHDFSQGAFTRIKLAELHFANKVYHNIGYISSKFRIYRKGDWFEIDSPVADAKLNDADVFSLNDLIEDATTLYTYRITHPSASSRDFFLWLKNPANRGYKRLLRFIGKAINEDFAFRLLLPIVQLAFYTTEPISAFRNLLCYANLMALEHPLVKPEAAFREMKAFLQKEYKMPGSSIADDDFITESPTCLIDPATYNQIATHAFDLYFPMKMHASKFLRELERNPDFEMFLCNPTAETHEQLNQLFSPYAVFYNFLGVKTNSNAILLSPEFSNPPSDEPGISEEYLFQLMRLREVTFSLLTLYNLDTPHNCHYTSCKFHDLQICRKWNAIPYHPDECEFPYWFRHVYHVDIDCQTRELVRLDKDSETVEKEYFALINKKRQRKEFSYTIQANQDKQLYVLYIPRKIVESLDLNFLPEFFEWIKTSQGISDADLVDSVIFDFTDYAGDPKPLYAITEVNAYLSDLFAQDVTLLALLNFSSAERNQAFIIIPLLVNVVQKELQDGLFGYEIAPAEHEELVLLYYYALNNYCEQHGIDKQIIETLQPTFYKTTTNGN